MGSPKHLTFQRILCRRPCPWLVVLADVVGEGAGAFRADAEFGAEGVGGDRTLVQVPVFGVEPVCLFAQLIITPTAWWY